MVRRLNCPLRPVTSLQTLFIQAVCTASTALPLQLAAMRSAPAVVGGRTRVIAKKVRDFVSQKHVNCSHCLQCIASTVPQRVCVTIRRRCVTPSTTRMRVVQARAQVVVLVRAVSSALAVLRTITTATVWTNVLHCTMW